MKIERGATTTSLSDVKNGEVFEWDGQIFLKAYSFGDSRQHYIRLKDGNECNVPENEKVIAYPNAKVVLE